MRRFYMAGKHGPNPTMELLDVVERQAAELMALVERLAFAAEVSRNDVDRCLEALLQAGQRLRESLYAGARRLGDPAPVWSDRAGLVAAVAVVTSKLEELEQRRERRRMDVLARELREARVNHRVKALRRRLEQLRSTAVESLSKVGRLAGLPWPSRDEPSWVLWILGLDDPEATGAHEEVQRIFPALADLLGSLEALHWTYPLPDALTAEPQVSDDVSSSGTLSGGDAAGAIPPIEMTVAGLGNDNRQVDTTAPRDGSELELHANTTDLGDDLEPKLHADTYATDLGEDPAPVLHAAITDTGDGQGLDLHDHRSATTSSEGPAPVFGPPLLTAPQQSVPVQRISEKMEVVACTVGPQPERSEPSNAGPPSSAPEVPRETEESLAAELPEALHSLRNFRLAFWRDGTGTLRPAPWASASFPALLTDAASAALQQRAFNRLVVYCRCAEERGIQSLPTREDLYALLALHAKPDAYVPDGMDARVQALFEVAVRAEHTLADQIRVLLVALCAAPERAAPANDITAIIKGAGLADSTVGNFLTAALRLGLEADRPIGLLRAELRAAPQRTVVELERELAAARTDLDSLVKQLHHAAGNRVRLRHCIDAWSEFMRAARPRFDDVLAGKISDTRSVDDLLGLYATIADQGGARYQERIRMDRAARQLVDAARKIVVIRQELDRHQSDRPLLALPNLVATYRALDAASTRVDAIFIPLLRELATTEASGANGGPVFEKGDFIRMPGILEAIPVVSIESGSIAVDPWSIADPLSATAHLLSDRSGDEPVPDLDLLAHLRECKREDLLVHVTPVSKEDEKRAQEAQKLAWVAQHHALTAAQHQLERMRQVVHPAAGPTAEAVQEALTAAESANTDGVKPELLTEWMRGVADFAASAVEQSILGMRAQFSRLSPSPTVERQQHFDRALARGQLAEVRALANGENLPPSSEGERATMWRRVALQTFSDPRHVLGEHRGQPAELVQGWLVGLRNEAHNEKLRRLFVEFVFASVLDLRDRNGKPVVSERHGAAVVRSRELREWLAERFNPAFVPQLTAFKEIIILAAPVPTSAESFVRQTVEAVTRAENPPKSPVVERITVILTPDITPQIRDKLREALRRPARVYAIVDDIDLARLVNPGGQQPNAVLGLLEIVLEQQPKWSPVNPFEPHEGQHTKAEMFVGREDEAIKLATRAQFSRLFSGRKLGKSALLKHIHDKYSGLQLPSSNWLRVLYVPVVGLDTESSVVDKIGECFNAQLEPTSPVPSGDPLERLKHLVTSYLDRKRDSLLVFLDEADMFVEAQIRDYEKRREKCLTWLMRTDLEAQRDSMDLPRVRFVFAGYRATHRNEAAWANWGDVLRLEPLSVDAATRLANGPLARLGIDASDEAATVAYLCGYQPAVIVQFGQRLVEHLDETYGPARREAVVVRSEDVSKVYQSSDVQNELRSIVWNNFVGNPFGRVVFAAMLLEFTRLAPAVPLDDAPERILRRLHAIVPGLLAGNSLEGSPRDRIARELRGFVERSLLQLVDALTQSYKLRFPHHLPILLQDIHDASIRREAAELGASAGAEPLQDVRTLLPRVGLLDLGEALTTDGYDAAVAASHWAAGLTEGAANIPDRLGIRPDEALETLDGLDVHGKDLRRRSLAVVNATPQSAERVLATRKGLPDGHRPLLLGGLDLLRWAIASRRTRHRELELATIARLNLLQFRWWFERIRAIEFAGPSSARELLEQTSGVPFLVGLVDRQLEAEVGFDGRNATEDQIRRVIAAYRAQFSKLAVTLVSGGPAVALERREAELLVMVQCASNAAATGAELRDVLANPEDWRDVFPWDDRHRLALRSEDEAHIELLLRAGLLPAAPDVALGSFDALTPITSVDAGYRLAEAIAPCLSL